jgi:hypothetical protein
MKVKTKTNKTIILIKQIYEKITCLENMYNCETFTIDTIPIYNDLFFDIYDGLKNINICLLNLKNNSLLTDFDKIRVNLNKLNYTLRSVIILVCFNQCQNTNEQGLINFDNVFNLDRDLNYISNDVSGCVIVDEFKSINILNDKYLLIESLITYDFTETNIVFIKNKIDYIIESLIEDTYLNFKNIIKNIKITKQIKEIKDEQKILNNKYNNINDSSSSIGKELENILKDNKKIINNNFSNNFKENKNFSNNFKENKNFSNNFKQIKNDLNKTIFVDILSNKSILKYIHYFIVIIVFRFLMKIFFFF